MVRWRVREVLRERGWSRYKLVQASGLKTTTVYRIARAKQGQVGRVNGKTLDALCAALGVGPGDLLEYIPEKRRKA